MVDILFMTGFDFNKTYVLVKPLKINTPGIGFSGDIKLFLNETYLLFLQFFLEITQYFRRYFFAS